MEVTFPSLFSISMLSLSFSHSIFERGKTWKWLRPLSHWAIRPSSTNSVRPRSICLFFEAPFSSNKEPGGVWWSRVVSALFHPCVSARWLCACLARCVMVVQSLLSLWGASTHSLHPPAVAALWDIAAHTAQIESLFLGPCSIPPTMLITSEMVIDGASLASLTLLKDSQTDIRGATDRSEPSPSKAGLHRELGAWFTNYSCSSTLLHRALPAQSRQLSLHR